MADATVTSTQRSILRPELVRVARARATMIAMADQPTQDMIASACAALAGPRYTLLDAADHVPDCAGLYAIYGGPEAWLQLGLGQAPASTALYVGKADDSLVTRDLQTHFRTGRTGQSTVRRSFAALLRDPLSLRGIPRNQTRPEHLADYALSEEHDALLTEWMTANLEIAVWPMPPDCAALDDVEVAVLKRWSPPLNLRDNRSTWGAKVSAARKLMASDARTWARERGHRL